jgi:hypothetical protein
MAAIVLALLLPGAPEVIGQSALAQLGLTETAARSFVLEEVKAPGANRLNPMALAGTRAFLKLPPAARGPAATALFAWAKGYVNSPAFTGAYAQHRRNVGATDAPETLSIDEEVKRKIDGELARFAQIRKEAAALPPDMAEATIAAVREAEQNMRSPEVAAAYRKEIESVRSRQSEQDAARALKLPANPQQLFARRLREFLDVTEDVNFAARTVSLNGEADGIVFVDRADRKRHWIWQEAVIVGPEATAAARAAAQAWLKEIER